jgi:predicted Zn-dependent protease
VLLDALGKLLERQGPSRRGKAIEYYRTTRARRPGLGIALSGALIRAGRADETEEVSQELTCQQPDNPALYNALGISLSTQRKFGAAEAAFVKATELQPDLAEAYDKQLRPARSQHGVGQGSLLRKRVASRVATIISSRTCPPAPPRKGVGREPARSNSPIIEPRKVSFGATSRKRSLQ